MKQKLVMLMTLVTLAGVFGFSHVAAADPSPEPSDILHGSPPGATFMSKPDILPPAGSCQIFYYSCGSGGGGECWVCSFNPSTVCFGPPCPNKN